MNVPSLKNEAAHCRQIAVEFAGRPEGPFLLQLASAMEELALMKGQADVIASGRHARPDEGYPASF